MKILMIDIDTLRPDHMGCYGYKRNTTPNIDKVAKDGIRFDEYYCANAPCLPSRAGLISGMFGIHNGAVGHGGTAADKRYEGSERGFRSSPDENNLFNIFRKAGMYTASISSFAERHSSYWFYAGLNEMHNVGKGGYESAHEVVPIALDWLKRNQTRQDWFLHLHVWDPHTPYRAPESFGDPFENQPLDNWITEKIVEEHLQHVGPHSLHEINMFDDKEESFLPRHPGSAKDLAGVKRIFDGYDTGILYADHLLGQVFDLLREQGKYEETAIIITADHGENFGELGIYAEHATADCATCRIPMIIKWPGVKGGVSDDALHYNIDLAPTMADMLGIPHFEKWDGHSYYNTLMKQASCGRNYLVLSQMAHVCQRSVRFGNWLYMKTYHDGLHLFDGDEMLFDVQQDPYEQSNIIDAFPEIRNQAAAMLLEWHDSMMQNSDYPIDPMQTVLREGGPLHCRGCLDMYCERLNKTGRAEGARRLQEKHKKEKK